MLCVGFPGKPFFLLLLIILLLKPPTVLNVSSIDVGDKFVYEINVFQTANITEKGYWIYLKLELGGSITLIVKGARANKLVMDVETELNKRNYTIDTNHPERERILEQWRLFMGFLLSMLGGETRGVETPIEAIILPHGEALAKGPLSIYGGGIVAPEVEPRLIEARSTIYAGRSVIYTRYDLLGREAEVDGLLEIYIDTASGLIIEAKATLTGSSVQGSFSSNIVVKLKNTDSLRNIVRREYRVVFINGIGKLHVSAKNLSVELISVEGTRLSIRLHGSGIGLILIEAPIVVDVEEVYVDGVKVNYTLIESKNTKFIGIPAVFSTRNVEIRFNQEIRSVEESKPLLPIVASIAILAIIAAIAVGFVVAIKLTIRKKQSIPQQPQAT